MPCPHKLLRDYIEQRAMTAADLAATLRISTSTMSRKLNGHTPWTSDEMWQIMSSLGIPAKQLHLIFPAGGVAPPPRPVKRKNGHVGG